MPKTQNYGRTVLVAIGVAVVPAALALVAALADVAPSRTPPAAGAEACELAAVTPDGEHACPAACCESAAARGDCGHGARGGAAGACRRS